MKTKTATKTEVARRDVGRPSPYDPETTPKQASKLARLGATDRELAEFFEVSIVTICAWKNRHPEFLKALKPDKDIADDRVERSLYHRAIGYSYEKTVYFNIGTDIYEYQEMVHVPPSDTAIIFWLKNRKPKEWRDKHEIEATTNHNITMNVNADGKPLSLVEKQARFRQLRALPATELRRDHPKVIEHMSQDEEA